MDKSRVLVRWATKEVRADEGEDADRSSIDALSLGTEWAQESIDYCINGVNDCIKDLPNAASDSIDEGYFISWRALETPGEVVDVVKDLVKQWEADWSSVQEMALVSEKAIESADHSVDDASDESTDELRVLSSRASQDVALHEVDQAEGESIDTLENISGRASDSLNHSVDGLGNVINDLIDTANYSVEESEVLSSRASLSWSNERVDVSVPNAAWGSTDD